MDPEIEECIEWLNCQLADIQTFLGGIEERIKGDTKRFPGGGNLSVPILVYSHLEYISALFCGKSAENANVKKCKECKRIISDYNATQNVKLFVEKFFPNNYKQYPLLFWDGIRNAVTHRFSPKALTVNEAGESYTLRFQFYVEDNKIPAYAEMVNSDLIFIKVNAFELYTIVKKATSDYFSILESDTQLQQNCLEVWKAIKAHSRDITRDTQGKCKEAKLIISQLAAGKGKTPLLTT